MAKGTTIRGTLVIKEPLLTAGLLTVDANGVVSSVAGTPITTVLPSSQILVGNASNLATAVAMTGDITISNTGVTSITAGSIIDADVNASAAIALTKLAASTASVVPQFNVSGFLEPSSVTNSELANLSGSSSPIQAQLNAKQATITGGATTITTANLTASRALVSNGSGKVEVSTVTITELGYVSGVTSALQTQLDSKLDVVLSTPANGDTIIRDGGNFINLPIGTTGQVYTVSAGGIPEWASGTSNGLPSGGSIGQYLTKNSGTDYDVIWDTLTVSKITDVTAVADDINILAGAFAAGVTATEFQYIDGLTSNAQTQIDNKQSRSLAYNALWVGDAGNLASQLPAGSNDQVLTVVGGVPQWVDPTPPGNVSGVAPSTDHALVRWNGALADSIQNSGIIIDDSDNVSGVVTLSTGQVSVLNQAAVRLYETGSTNYVDVRAAGTMAGNYTITLPAAAPSANTFLKYDGADYVWAAGGGGGTSLNQKTEVGTTYTPTDADDGYVIYFTNAAGCTITMDDAISTNVSFTTVRAVGAGVITHVDDGTSVLLTINSEFDIEVENGAATWVKESATDFYGWGALGAAGAGTGTVTSVALSLPAIFSVAGSPITTSGTLTATLATQTANTVWSGPTGGGAATPTFRALVAADIPNISATYYLASNPSGYISGNQAITLSGDVTGTGTTAITTVIATNAVTDAKIRQSAGLSVIGRTTNTTGNVADITAASDYSILRRSGTAVAFGAIDLSQSGAVGSSILPIANGGTGSSTVNWLELTYTGNTTLTNSTYSTTFSGTGAVGIGVTPTAKLQVRGNGTSTGELFKLEDSGGTERFKVLDSGAISATSTSISFGRLYIASAGSSILQMVGGAGTVDVLTHNTSNILALQSAGVLNIISSGNATGNRVSTICTMSQSSGTNSLVSHSIRPIINNTGGTNSVYGVVYSPTETSLTGTTQYAFAASVGLWGIGTLTPTHQAHIKATSSNQSIFLIEENGGTNAYEVIESGGVIQQSWFGATPQTQPTTGVAAATFAANTSGIVDDTATFDGYTIGQVVKVLRDYGLLA